MNRSLIALTLVLLLLGSVLVVPGAGASDQSDDAPSDANTTVDITLQGSSDENPGTELLLYWTVIYDAPSAEAARKAENGTLDVSWFEGDEAVQAVAANYPGSDVEIQAVQIAHDDVNSQHGQIRVYSRLHIADLFANEREQIVIGPTLAEQLSNGDDVKLTRPEHWKPTETNVSGDDRRGGEVVHRWTIGEDPEPRMVLNESAAEDAGLQLGNGPVVAVVAIALATIALAARRRA